jgi:ribosomal protein L19E
MQLAKKKILAANVLGVGKGRVIFLEEHFKKLKKQLQDEIF